MLHKLTGRLDMDSCGELAKTLTSKLNQPLELDFSEVSAVDSAALSLILELRRAAAIQGQSLKLRNLPDELGSLAMLYGIDPLLSPIERTDV